MGWSAVWSVVKLVGLFMSRFLGQLLGYRLFSQLIDCWQVSCSAAQSVDCTGYPLTNQSVDSVGGSGQSISMLVIEWFSQWFSS